MNQMWARPQTDMTPVSDPLTSSPNAPNMPVASIKGELVKMLTPFPRRRHKVLPAFISAHEVFDGFDGPCSSTHNDCSCG